MQLRGYVTLCAVLALFAAAASAQDYQILLDRPAKAGETLTRATAITGKLTVIAKDGQTVLDNRTSTYTVDYAADVTVVEVDRSGNVTKDTHKIIRCRRIENEVTTEYFQPGTVITASLENGQVVFTKDGKPVTQEQAGILGTLIVLGPGKHSEDEVFGTNLPRKMGDAWAINGELAAADLSGQMPRTPSYSGTAQLAGIIKVNNVDCAEVRIQMTNPSFAPVAPRGVTVTGGSSSLSAVIDAPTDLSLPVLRRQLSYVADFQTYAPPPPNTKQSSSGVTVDTRYEKQTVTEVSNVKM
jgi:hypothetical protein